MTLFVFLSGTRVSEGIGHCAAHDGSHSGGSASIQSQKFFPSVDLNLARNWELNFGAGVTRSPDRLILKCIVGRRFAWADALGGFEIGGCYGEEATNVAGQSAEKVRGSYLRS